MTPPERENLPEEVKQQLGNFARNELTVRTLIQPLTVERVFGGQATIEGRWFTHPGTIQTSTEARQTLALPETNDATRVVQAVIPAGPTIYEGQSAGGGIQIFITFDELPEVLFGEVSELPP